MQVNMTELERIGRQIDGAYGIAVTLSTALDETEGDAPWTHAATGLMELLDVIRKRHGALIEASFQHNRQSSEQSSKEE